MLLFAEDIGIRLNTKSGFSRIQQALEYSRIAKDVLGLVKAVSESADDIHRHMPDLVHELSAIPVFDNSTGLQDEGKLFSMEPDSDRGSVMNVLSGAIERKDELNLCALVEHFKECHVVVDPCSQLRPCQFHPPNRSAPSANPKFDPYIPDSAQVHWPQEQRRQTQPRHQLQQLQHAQKQDQQGLFDPDDTELHMYSSTASSSAPTTPLTPLTTHFVPYTTQRAIPDASSFTPSFLSRRPSGCSPPVSALNVTSILPSRASTSMSALSRTQRDFFTSAYSDHDAVTPPPQAPKEIAVASRSQPGSSYSYVSPTLLYGPSSTPADTSFSSSVPSPVAQATQGQMQGSYHPLSTQASSATSSHLSKSFCCSKSNCSKSYTQMNALKYDLMTHCHCNFAPPEDAEARKTLVTEKGIVVNGNDYSRVQTMEGELREVERETECQLRPFACGVSDYPWRYRSMKGLRSHYQHSKSAAATHQSTLAHSATTSPSSPSLRKYAPPLWHYPQGFGQSRYVPSDVLVTPPSTREHVPASSHDPLGRLLSDHLRGLSTDDPQCVDVTSTPSSPAQRLVPTLRPGLTPPNNFASNLMHEPLTNDQHHTTSVRTSPFPAEEHISASPLGPIDKPLSDHRRESFIDNQQSVNATRTPSSSTQEHVPVSQPSRWRIPAPPDKLHPTLSFWIKNMNRLSSLIDHLQEFASSAPAKHRSRLLRQVAVLRTTSKKQKEHLMEFLELSEECANQYLLDISAEIQQQRDCLDKLEERSEAAEKLRGEAVELKKLYDSGTVATMKQLRATALSRPLPEDHALFSEVDSVLIEIRHCYTELVKFWAEEVSRAIEVLQTRHVDQTDSKRWRNFHPNLKQTILSWKNQLPGGDAQTLRRHKTCSSNEADIGAIASSLSSAMGSLTSALDRLSSSNSLKYSQSGRSLIKPVYLAFAANSDVCLSFLQNCVDYGENAIAWCLVSPTSCCVGAPHDLRERTMRLQSKIAGVSVENSAGVQGPRKFKTAYEKALRLEQKTSSGLNSLLEKLSTKATVTDGHGIPDDVLIDVITLEQLRRLWEKAGYSVHEALATLKNEPAPKLSTRPLTVMKRWLMNFVCYS